MKTKKLKIKEVARRLDVDPSHICRIFSNKSRPGPELARKLEEVTGVKRLAWLYPDEYPNPFIMQNNHKLRNSQ
jgi:transcriptional regulator with XRE-family HTH domain